MNSNQKAQARRAVNNSLAELGRVYHDSIPNAAVDQILTGNGFNALAEGIYCGRDGQVREEVGFGLWISLVWHKMEVTGRYEIVAYVN